MFSNTDAALVEVDDASEGVPPPPPPLSEYPAAKRLKTEGKCMLFLTQISLLVFCVVSILNGIAHAGPGTDDVRVALEKLGGHISNPRKFKKASPLLRQLLKEGRVTKDYASLLFQVVSLAATMPDGLRSLLCLSLIYATGWPPCTALQCLSLTQCGAIRCSGGP